MLLNIYLIGSLGLILIWLLLFLIRPSLRKEMLLTSIFTTPLGLTEPLFVPAYWNPPSLFNLASKTGFDIESLIFSFAVGGIASVIYETLIKAKHKKMLKSNLKRRPFHFISIISPSLIFIALYFTPINPIYSAIISLFIGAVLALLCRPDLKKNTLYGGLTFLLLYFVLFIVLNLLYPNFVKDIWNFSTISGILILGVPLEELLFAFSFGLVWSSIYEHIREYRLTY